VLLQDLVTEEHIPCGRRSASSAEVAELGMSAAHWKKRRPHLRFRRGRRARLLNTATSIPTLHVGPGYLYLIYMQGDTGRDFMDGKEE